MTTTAPAALAARSTSKSRLAYDAIRDKITDGSYTPGYRLVLGQLAKELDVSTVPVREAIRLLEAEGLVTFERNVGAQVALVDKAEYQYTMQTLSLVEGYATALSLPSLRRDRGMNASPLARAQAINDEMTDCLRHFDPVRFTRLNLAFHTVLFEYCPNPHLLDLVHRGWNRLAVLRESTFSFVPGRAHESVEEHTALLELIAGDADPLDVELCARDHRLATLNAFLEHEKTTTTEGHFA